MSKNKIKVKPNQLIVQKVNFDGNEILAVQDIKLGKIYVGVNYICKGLGLNKSRKDSQIQMIQNDKVLKLGCLKFQSGVFDDNNEVLAIELDYLPIWLAKINITPKIEKELPELASKLIKYQLKAKDVLALVFLKEKEQWNLQREVGKVDREKLTNSINKYIPDSPNKKFAYPNYTNLIYKTLFGKDAKQLKLDKDKSTNDLLRDSFNKEELILVEEAETIVTALISLGFSYEQIKIHLKNKFNNIKVLT
jgi:hypothetical protein